MAFETCEFYITNWDDPPQTLVGRVILRNGKLEFKPEKGHEIFMKEIKAAKENIVGKRLFHQTKDPKGWFNSLPIEYRGSMVRAQIVKTSGRKRGSLAREGGSGSGAKAIKGGKDK